MTDERETVTERELLLATAAEVSALIELLARKGLVTKEELLHEIRAMRERMHEGERRGSA